MARLLACLLATGLLCTATVNAGRMLLSDEEQPGDSPLMLPETEQAPSLRSRVEAVAVENTVILTQTSCGYLEFAINWINSVQKLGITNWLTIVEDADSLAYINERYPGHAVAASEFTNEALNSGSALFEYGTEAFTRLACARPVYLQTVLDLGFSAVWSDTDTVWLQNLLSIAPRDLDYVGVDDSEQPEQETDNACTGLMYLNPTDKAKALMRAWHDTCQEQKFLNQPAWNEVFSQDARRDIGYKIMPRTLYPHGQLTAQVYDPDQADYIRSLGISPETWEPAWIHANYRVGRGAKRAYLKERDAWSISHDTGLPTCSLLASLHHS